MKTSLEKLIEKHSQELVGLEQLHNELLTKLAETKTKIVDARAKEKELHNLWLRNN
tara:strand:- start:1178 stop:1345 length:168 start_codon:yes stop_codon:yes gene_type:complete